MITQISISNYALIDGLELRLQPGMTVLTGETGSGKSIILGALNLILGQRAETGVLKDPERKCIIEALFRIDPEIVRELFHKHDLDLYDEVSIRREISPQGKSRAFVNDTPVTLQVLNEIGNRLVDLHSQHENLLLGQRRFQFDILDQVAGQQTLFADYREGFRKLEADLKELANMEAAEDQARLDEDYLRFQLEELDKIDLSQVDEQSMEEERKTLGSIEEIKRSLIQVVSGISGEGRDLIGSLGEMEHALNRIADINPALKEFKERISSVKVELKDLSMSMEDYESGLQLDEERLQKLDELQNLLFGLLQKHRLNSVSELQDKKEEIIRKLGEIGSLEDLIKHLRSSIKDLTEELEQKATLIAQGRRQAAAKLEQEVVSVLSDLQMPHATIRFELKESEALHSYGKDEINLLFRANKGGQEKPIQKVASGGEISRMMLALKAVLSRHRHMPTLILDEIDAGVSGETAARMGELMKGLRNSLQVITITHLPQVAGMADHHFKVSKHTSELDTITRVQQLSMDERIQEIASLLSGLTTTDAAFENARQLLQSGQD